jgi:rhamnose utilization protein RhaD (predicted bifunctional aldolase and dehydrogenase)
MKQLTPAAGHTELRQLIDLTQRVGNNPLLTQASTGNSSVKLDGVLWIKASGKWMADAGRDDIFIPLDLPEVVNECLRRHVDPSSRYPRASLETALHAVLPQRMVLHLHCVDTIAWAVMRDGPAHLQRRLEGIRWQWIPYVSSGLPLAMAIERALSRHPDTNLFVLSNHGLVVCGEDSTALESLLSEARRRLAIRPRKPSPPDYTALWEMARNSCWELPDDDLVHTLGTDPDSRAILSGGILYPCQAIFAGSLGAMEMFRPVSHRDAVSERPHLYDNRPFLIVEERGVVVNRTIKPAALAMIYGLAQVVQRLSTGAPLRYLTDAEIAGISVQATDRYRELASVGRAIGIRTV